MESFGRDQPDFANLYGHYKHKDNRMIDNMILIVASTRDYESIDQKQFGKKYGEIRFELYDNWSASGAVGPPASALWIKRD